MFLGVVLVSPAVQQAKGRQRLNVANWTFKVLLSEPTEPEFAQVEVV